MLQYRLSRISSTLDTSYDNFLDDAEKARACSRIIDHRSLDLEDDGEGLTSTSEFLAELFDVALFFDAVAPFSFSAIAIFLPDALTDCFGTANSSVGLSGAFRVLGFFAVTFSELSVLNTGGTTTASSRAAFLGLPRFLIASADILDALNSILIL